MAVIRKAQFILRRQLLGGRLVWTVLAGAWLWGIGAQNAFGETDLQERISLKTLCRSRGFQSLTVSGTNATLSTRFHALSLAQDSRRSGFDGVAVWLNGPVEKSWGRLNILEADVAKTVVPLFNPTGVLTNAGYRVVVLDAGHGGEDRGASIPGRGVDEKQLVLELAQAVRTILARYQVDVRLTRAADRAVPLEERSQLAAAWKADVFISLHFNAAGNAKSSGLETYIVTPAGFPSTADRPGGGSDLRACLGNRYDPANLVLGYTLQKRLLKYTRAEDRGVRHARFVVLRNAPCPAALVECGFLSSPTDQQKILTGSYRNDLARSLAEGILAYLNTVKRARNLNP
jgi:N-acetylmuramoyl-L-alanine amidase